ncbi:MAG TPA: SRPBCC family protein [Puia sp.]|nr:SRPBCC family protein [Puia sp.]
MESLGKMLAPDTLRFERTLRGPIERVWAYLTESEKRGKWLAKGEMELFEGGKVNLYFLHNELSPEAWDIPEKFKGMEGGHGFTGTVLRVNPPHLLSFTWEGDSEVTFELHETDDAVLLQLTHRKLPTDQASRLSVLGGWHTHLDILVANFSEVVPPNFWQRYTKMEEVYRKISA